MHYFIGDIHGYLDRLKAVFLELDPRLREGDTLVFLGDYIDRGPRSYEVIDFMVHLSKRKDISCVFLKGNHEVMMFDYLRGNDRRRIYKLNGGEATEMSYVKNVGSFTLESIPAHHRRFYDSLVLYHEGEDFIAVHAGFNPAVSDLDSQREDDMLWIREEFFRHPKKWKRTIIFGHTPVNVIQKGGSVYMDDERNIIGIDGGVIYGKKLVCMSWPDREIIKG